MTEKGNANDPWRPAFHFAPPNGWMNDPNGLIYWRGRYQLFYQSNPHSQAPDGPMHWGHADSEDLLHWRDLPMALEPDEPYLKGMGCWSGSAVEHEGGIAAVFTGVDRIEEQTVCLATSRDGVAFTKDPGNPVIKGPPEGFGRDFRDPRVFRWKDGWRLVIGASRDGTGSILLYESRDLRKWSLLGVFARSDGSRGTMWECPDLFPLADRWVLVVSPIGMPGVGVLALIGRLDDDGRRFEVEESQVLDFGRDFYAPQSMEGPGGRRIMIGWMDYWGSPDPPTKALGWRGAMAIPRAIRLGPGGRGLSIEPVDEVRGLRTPLQLSVPGMATARTADLEVELEAADGADGEFEAVFRGSADGTRGARLVYSAARDEVLVDPSRSGDAAREPRRMPGLRSGGKVRLRALLDACSLEVFAGDPPMSPLSTVIFPCPDDLTLSLRLSGHGVKVSRLSAWRVQT